MKVWLYAPQRLRDEVFLTLGNQAWYAGRIPDRPLWVLNRVVEVHFVDKPADFLFHRLKEEAEQEHIALEDLRKWLNETFKVKLVEVL